MNNKTKISIEIHDETLAYFKAKARSQDDSYQRMIRKLLLKYVRENPLPIK